MDANKNVSCPKCLFSTPYTQTGPYAHAHTHSPERKRSEEVLKMKMWNREQERVENTSMEN